MRVIDRLFKRKEMREGRELCRRFTDKETDSWLNDKALFFHEVNIMGQ